MEVDLDRGPQEIQIKIMTGTAGQAQVQEQRTAEWYKQQTNESVKRSLRALEETDQIATDTCVQLNAQTEQINRTQDMADEVETNLDTSEKILKSRGRSSWTLCMEVPTRTRNCIIGV